MYKYIWVIFISSIFIGSGKTQESPAQAAINAYNDCKNATIYDRYIWFRGENVKEDMQSFLYDLNEAAQLGVNLHYRPPQIGERLLRINLKAISEDLKGLQKNLKLWEEYQYDPDFSTLYTKETVKYIKKEKIKTKRKTQEKTNWREIPSAPYTHNGRTYNTRWEYDLVEKEEEVNVQDLTDVDVIRFDGEHLDLEPYINLKLKLNTEAPIINSDYFSTRALATIKGKGVYKTIFGGLYYEHVNLERGNDNKLTDQDLLFKRLGVKREDIEERKSDRRLAMFVSKITGTPRIIEWMPHTAAPPEKLPIIVLTGDISRTDIDIGKRAMFNLLKPRVTAIEGLITRANGTILYVLINATNGQLVEKAPDDVARDHTVTAPNTTELQASTNCRACHGPFDGWQPARNDIELINPIVLDSNPDNIQRIQNLYQGNMDGMLRMLKILNATETLKITGPWKESKDQTDVVKLTYARSTKRWRDYNFGLIGQKQALYELGIKVKENNEEELINKLLPLIDLEDIRVLGLKKGLELTRSDWALGYSFIAIRTQETLQHEKGLSSLGGIKLPNNPKN